MAGNDKQFARMMMGSSHPSLPQIDHVPRTTPALNNMSTTVARSSSSSSTLTGPSTMVSATVVNRQRFDVDISDPEYVKIKADLDRIGRKMTRLVKLNNTILIDNFETESAHLKKIKKQPDFQLNIQSLYHGTRAPLDQICDEGLDERLSRRGRFGRGIYFSDNPEKCCKYAEHGTQKPYLLRCRVIMGDVKKYDIGEQDTSLTREPLKTVKDGKRVYYDSVQGQPHKDKPDHTEYVIYEKRRVLLDYVIYYIPPPQPSSAPKRSIASVVTPSTHQSTHQLSAETKSPLPDSGRSTPSSGSGAYSGTESPRSGRSSPAFAPATEEGEEEPVQRVSVTRNRTAARVNDSLASAMVSCSIQVTGASSSSTSTASNTAGQAATASRAIQPSLAATSTPHVLALKNLLELKGSISQDQYDALTKSYFQTYGVLGDGGSTVTEKLPRGSPSSAIMSELIREFKAITNCHDVTVCRQYIQLANMDLNQAVGAYMDAHL